jgi:hypothetical protein
MYHLELWAMTSRDPDERGPVSAPEHRMATVPNTVVRRERWSPGTIAATAIGAMLLLVGVMYGVSQHTTTTASNPPSTVGQGGAGSR